MNAQHEFSFSDTPGSDLPLRILARASTTIALLWKIPVGQHVHVALRNHNFSDLQGLLELSRVPDMPFDGGGPLELRIGNIEFSTRQIIAWR
jgi:hypothetical protein